MPDGARLATVVMFVRQLDRSVSFYTDLLALMVADRDATAALLTSQAGSHLVLRAMGSEAVHELGGTGIQYVTWAAASKEDLDRCERVLKERSAHTGTNDVHGVTVVEGRDPDGVAVAVCYPDPGQIPFDELKLWPRLYAW